MNDRLEYRRSLGLPKDDAPAHEWHCANCGSPGLERSCGCVTDVVCRCIGGTHEHSIKAAAQLGSTNFDGAESYEDFQRDNLYRELAKMRRALETTRSLLRGLPRSATAESIDRVCADALGVAEADLPGTQGRLGDGP